MTYYEVLVLVTILLTSLVAFYLLYKAKELNLGIVISISIGSIILGFTFSPAFKLVLQLLSDNINIGKKLVLIISLLIVLFIFLLFILIVSFIISISIPKRLASKDCCIVIDRIIAGIKIRDGIVNIKNKLTGFFRKIVSNMQETVKNVYYLINKLKKPVDTRQIIDTMGIEKNENGISKDKSNNTIATPDSFAFANLIAFMEPSEQVNYSNQDSSIAADMIEQTLVANDSAYESLAAAAYQEIVTTKISDIDTDENVVNDLPVIMEEDQVAEIEVVEIDIVESKVPQLETAEAEQSQKSPSDGNYADEFEIENDIIDIIEYSEEIAESESIIDANSLVLKAFESKDADRKEEAIECYMEALQNEPDNEMIFWIVLDVCALYKQLGLSELAKNILEGLVSEYGTAIQPEVKMEIMNYLK